MRKLVIASTAAASLLATVGLAAAAPVADPGSPAAAPMAPDRVVELTAGQSYSFKGTPPTTPVSNQNYWGQTTTGTPGDTVLPEDTCTKDPLTYCEVILVKAALPIPADQPIEYDDDGNPIPREVSSVLDISAINFAPVPDPVTDYDLRVLNSDASGARLDEAGSDGSIDLPPAHMDENVSIGVRTTEGEDPVHYFRVEVVYYTVPAGSTYDGKIQF